MKKTSSKQVDKNLSNVRLVGIGASAGGLEALRDLLSSLPESSRLSYVIAQHISPTHVSMLHNLLSPLTHLTVNDLSDRLTPKAGTVYITPPNNDVILEKGCLRLVPPRQVVGPKPSITHFFYSLVEELGDQAIGVILSGTGSDGASGIRAIKAAGGITIVQDPDTAKYDGMPKAAIRTGSVDLILAPHEIGNAIDRLLEQNGDLASIEKAGDDSDEYTQISNLVRHHTSFKLKDYKASTVKRRIARRMNIIGMDELGDYINYMRANKKEAQQLIRDTFISVTAFFRDQSCFDALKQSIEDLLKQKSDDAGTGTIRCWIPGCATGEEVYSIAMLFEEALYANKQYSFQYMIFASDMDDNALDFARAGLYPLSEMSTIPKEFRQRYFETIGDHCRVRKDIRNRTVFARQNVIEDPPFSRIDLVSCRNLLIYLTQEAQKRIFELFHYALNPEGVLFLGKSEGADSYKELFRPVIKHARIYARISGKNEYLSKFTQSLQIPTTNVSGKNERRSGSNVDELSIRTLEALAVNYAPPSLVINDSDTVVHFQGDLKPFLKFPQGRVNLNLYDLVDNAMRAELRALVYRCRRDLKTIRGATLDFHIDGQFYNVQPFVRPLESNHYSMIMVSFQSSLRDINQEDAQTNSDSERNDLIISELEQELANTRTHLNIVVEELETSNEELQSLNEELQSANEELQSTNEELQTSNEELQSTNEELLTVNEELQVKSTELEETTVDLTNVKESLAFPLIVVNQKLLTTHYNKACHKIFNVDGPVVNCVINSIEWRIDVPNLYVIVRRVIDDGVDHISTLPVSDELVYRLFVMPYKNLHEDNVGAVLLFEDITAQFKTEQALRESNERYDLVEQGTSDGIWDWIIGTEPYWSPHYKDILGYQEHELASSLKEWRRRLHPDDKKTVLMVLDDHLEHGAAYDLEYRFRHKSGDYVWIHARGQVFRDNKGQAVRMTGSITDVSKRKQIEIDLHENQEKFHVAMLHAPSGTALVALDGSFIKVNPALCRILGYSEEELLKRDFQSLTYSDDLDEDLSNVKKLLAGEINTYQMEKRYVHRDGHLVWAQLNVSLAHNKSGEPLYFIRQTQDISQRKVYEGELNLVSSIFTNTLDGIVITDVSSVILKANPAFEDILGYSSDEIIGQHVRLFNSNNYDEHFYQSMWTTIKNQGAWQGEVWDRHKDGHLVPIWLGITAINDEQGNPKNYIAVMHDISEQKLTQERIHRLAHYDALTGLPNRVLFMDRLSYALSGAKRNHGMLALLFIDLDKFKNINDSRGHHVGDELLILIAERISKHVRETDTLSRLSGDEFVMFINCLSENQAKTVAAKVLRTLADPFDLPGGQAYITASIGIAMYPSDGDTPDLLLRHADLAMYKSKESGRNHFHFYTEEMSVRIEELTKLNNDLRIAIEEQSLMLYYQPIIDLSSGVCVGAEALLRWLHPKMGWIPPEKFIPIAEDNDLIVPLGEWVLLTACQQMTAWLKNGFQLRSISVNVSGKQITAGNFVNAAKRVMKETKCPKNRITLELTESFIMKGSEQAIKAQHQLRRLGFGLSIDDFGTGFSSLNYLKRMPLTQLKLDKSFVMGLPDDTNDAAIVQAILALGHTLGMKTVAEGVEQQAQRDFLVNVNCQLSQGFYYAKPMPAEEFAQFIAHQS